MSYLSVLESVGQIFLPALVSCPFLFFRGIWSVTGRLLSHFSGFWGLLFGFWITFGGYCALALVYIDPHTTVVSPYVMSYWLPKNRLKPPPNPSCILASSPSFNCTFTKLSLYFSWCHSVNICVSAIVLALNLPSFIQGVSIPSCYALTISCYCQPVFSSIVTLFLHQSWQFLGCLNHVSCVLEQFHEKIPRM